MRVFRKQEFYIITNEITKKQYVGRTSKNYMERFNQHFQGLYTCPSYFFHLFSIVKRKYGKNNFSVKFLGVAYNINEIDANKIERELIYKYKTNYPNGYNLNGCYPDKKIRELQDYIINGYQQGKLNIYLHNNYDENAPF